MAPEIWRTGLGHEPRAPLTPLRVILIWDTLAGHVTGSIVDWLFQHAEALQRIIVRRALAGQHLQTPEAIITWLEETVTGWNENPTPLTGAASARSDGPEHDNNGWVARPLLANHQSPVDCLLIAPGGAFLHTFSYGVTRI